MIFFFEQKGQFVRCEVLPLPDGGSELVVTHPEGTQTTEILRATGDVTRRVSEISETMVQAGWWGPIGRDF